MKLFNQRRCHADVHHDKERLGGDSFLRLMPLTSRSFKAHRPPFAQFPQVALRVTGYRSVPWHGRGNQRHTRQSHPDALPSTPQYRDIRRLTRARSARSTRWSSSLVLVSSIWSSFVIGTRLVMSSTAREATNDSKSPFAGEPGHRRHYIA